jgi:hypothetical protein
MVVCRTLQLNPELKLNRLILSAAILPCSFPWCDVVSFGRITAVLNEHCPQDRVVPLSKAWLLLGLETGESGCHGFDETCDGAVNNVHYAHTGHNRLITPLHMEEAWLPFLFDGTIPSGDPKPRIQDAGPGVP